MDVIDNRTERVFTADYAKKTIIVPKDEQVIGVKGDSRGRAIRFELLKVPDELDLSQCVIEVQYQNALGETGRQKVLHLEESQADGTKRIFFYFRPPLSLTQAAGTVYLQVCGTYAYSSGYYHHWHLAPAAVEIADFFDCEETALADPKDDLTIQIQADIASLETQMDEIKDTLNNLTGTGDEVSENMVAEIVAVKNRVTTLEGDLKRAIIKRDFTATCTTTGSDQLVQVPMTLPSGYVPLAAVNVAANGFVSHFYVESFSTTAISCWGNTQSGKTITVSMLFIRDDLY